MAATYSLQIITPNETVYSGEIESLVAPGALGYLGVLAHHAPLLTSLAPGKLNLREANGKIRSFKVEGGILEVNPGGTVILTESVEAIEG
ncbi:MAG: ATP synthase F1 subunit epsilon [Candidatus Omnitrophota bacterium]|jgi:F-type H+-transporting ATPase subunit epsilon|nr:MAG: ATP synthase F1 subunit epsilon [Candidatus Omnitrophota bacterium]